jgi:hypothetical protein
MTTTTITPGEDVGAARASFRLPAGRGWDNANMVYLAHLIETLGGYSVIGFSADVVSGGADRTKVVATLSALIRRGRVREALATVDGLRNYVSLTTLSVKRRGCGIVTIQRDGTCIVATPDIAARVQPEFTQLIRPTRRPRPAAHRVGRAS